MLLEESDDEDEEEEGVGLGVEVGAFTPQTVFFTSDAMGIKTMKSEKMT